MEYKQEQYVLNNLCQFTNREVEADFMEYEKTASLNIVRFMLILLGFIFVLFAFSDYYYYGGGLNLYISLGFRSIALLITMLKIFENDT